MVVGAVVATSTSAFANFSNNYLYLGFSNPNGTADYIYSMGAASSIAGVSYVSFLYPLSLSPLPATLLGSNGSTTSWGVVGGNQSTPDMYYTIARSALGTPTVPGSTAPDPADNIETAVSALSGLSAPNINIATVDSSKSWNGQVLTDANNTFAGNAPNPNSLINIGGLAYEDLYVQNQDGATPTYLGYFTLDLTGGTSSPDVTFTPESVPEPSTVALAGLGGLMALTVSRRFTGKNA